MNLAWEDELHELQAKLQLMTESRDQWKQNFESSEDEIDRLRSLILEFHDYIDEDISARARELRRKMDQRPT